MLLFFFNDTATTEIYTLSLHDALPIYASSDRNTTPRRPSASTPYNRTFTSVNEPHRAPKANGPTWASPSSNRSEEHTSELQSRQYLVCRLLLEKKKKHTVLYRHLHITI